MNEILSSPAIQIFSKTVSAAGTDNTGLSTGLTAAIDIRTSPGLTAQVPQLPTRMTMLIGRGCQAATAPNKLLTYTIGHAASITDATSNSTALLTISETANTNLNVLSRVELDLIGLQPVIRFAASLQGTGSGTAEGFPLTVTCILSRMEQTPIRSSVLANGQVKIYAAGATQAD